MVHGLGEKGFKTQSCVNQSSALRQVESNHSLWLNWWRNLQKLQASASSFSINRLHSWHLRELHGLQDAAFNRAKLQIWGSHGAEMKHVLHCYNVTTCQRIRNCRLSLFLVNIMCEMWCEIWLNWCVFLSGEMMFEMMWVMVMMYDTWNDGWKSDVKNERGGWRNGGEKLEQQTYLQGHCLLLLLKMCTLWSHPLISWYEGSIPCQLHSSFHDPYHCSNCFHDLILRFNYGMSHSLPVCPSINILLDCVQSVGA